MKVELEITFTKDEVLAMCLAKCGNIETAVEGKFEARAGYYGTGEVVCTFVPRHAEESSTILAALPAEETEPVQAAEYTEVA